MANDILDVTHMEESEKRSLDKHNGLEAADVSTYEFSVWIL